MSHKAALHQGLHRLLRLKRSSDKKKNTILFFQLYPDTPTYVQRHNTKLWEESISIQMVN